MQKENKNLGGAVLRKISNKISCFLVSVLILSTVLPSVAFASNYQDNLIANMSSNYEVMGDGSEGVVLSNNYQDNIITYKPSNNEVIRTESVGAVLVFVGGVLVGYIVDGVLIYASGQSGGEWVAQALSYYFAHPGVSAIYDGGGGGSW